MGSWVVAEAIFIKVVLKSTEKSLVENDSVPAFRKKCRGCGGLVFEDVSSVGGIVDLRTAMLYCV